MAADTASLAVKESGSFLCIAGNDIANFVGKAIRNICGTRMQEHRNVCDLFRCEGRKTWHSSILSAIANYWTDCIPFVVVKYERRTYKVRAALSSGVISVAEAAGRHKNLAAAFS